MAYKQPNVPRLSGDEGQSPALTRFLKDFCMAAWHADRRKDAEIETIKRRLDALERRTNGEEG